jgi:stage V sporulation protein G
MTGDRANKKRTVSFAGRKNMEIRRTLLHTLFQEESSKVQITDVRVRCLETEGKLRAVASVVFEGQFVVHDIRVIEGTNGFFVAMPQRKTPEGDYRDVAHPITAEAREQVQKAVLDAYARADMRQAGD